MKVITKYLKNYAEQETLAVAHFPKNIRARHTLVIPAYDEPFKFIHAITLHPSAENILLIVVINCPTPSLNHLQAELWHTLEQESEILWRPAQKAMMLCQINRLKVLAVDRFSITRTIPTDKGVGLARKIGCDIACQLYLQGNLEQAWVFSSDADAKLPNNYFSKHADESLTKKLNKASATIFDFSHTVDADDISKATAKYDTAIKYYRNALSWAGSPYAYNTLGSALAFSIKHYCQVRGFPKRPGGEDFYLINKLAKVGELVFLKDIKIQITSRVSHRVPFGTGPAVKNILALEKEGQVYTYYNAKIFALLKLWLSSANKLFPKLEKSTEPLADLPKNLQLTLHELGVEQFLVHAKRQCKNPQVFQKHFTDWFDAFRTLKFVRSLQKSYYPPTSLEESIRELKLLSTQASHEITGG